MEITFVDEDNINRYFNEGSKVFKRPVMAIDREVFSCHPPKIEAKVRRIIEEFRIGTLDEVPVWMDKQGRTMLVKYIAVRDKQGIMLELLRRFRIWNLLKNILQSLNKRVYKVSL